MGFFHAMCLYFPPIECIRIIFHVITEIYLIMVTVNIFKNILSIQYFLHFKKANQKDMKV